MKVIFHNACKFAIIATKTTGAMSNILAGNTYCFYMNSFVCHIFYKKSAAIQQLPWLWELKLSNKRFFIVSSN